MATGAWKSRIETTLKTLIAVAVASFAIREQRPPAPIPSDAPAAQFSAERAMIHVRAIASEPHPLGSERNARVVSYLMEEMTRLGLSPSIQSSRNHPGRSPIGVLKGRQPGRKAVMLVAHHDSRPEGPGAGDDAAGVAAILETIRALKTGPQLDNDVIVLFTDGEEVGLFGSRTFAEDSQWRERVGVVLNFEGRGSRGPSYLFETSPNNGWMIREVAAVTPHPIGSSLAGAVYRLMPNDTDLSNFKGAGLAGLNFAYVDGVENYHKPTDVPENLDRGSLQHQGSYALSLARRFGGLDLSLAASEPDAVYFSLLGPHLVRYPGSWVVPSAILAGLFYQAVAALLLRRGRITVKGVMLAALAALVALALGAMTGWVTWRIVGWTGLGEQGSPAIAGLLVIPAMIVTSLVLQGARSGRSSEEMPLGSLGWWMILALVTAVLLPGGNYFFEWPLVFGLVGLLVKAFGGSIGEPIGGLIGSFAPLAIVPPTLVSLCAGLGPKYPFAPSLVAPLLVVAVLPLLARSGRMPEPHS